MTAQTLVVAALITVSGVLVLLTIATIARKTLAGSAQRRRVSLEAKIRPGLLELLVSDEPDFHDLVPLRGASGRSVERLVAGLLPKLRGADREVLTGLLDRRGALARARVRTKRHGRVGRARAAELLGATGDARASIDLERLLEDHEPEVRAVAARALGKLGEGASVPALLATLDAERSVPASLVTMAVLHLGPDAVGGLRQGLGSPSSRSRTVCAELLGRLGALESAGELAGLLSNDPDPAVRRAAAGAVGRIGLPQAIAPLIDCMRHCDESDLRCLAAVALGDIGGPAAIGGLRFALVSSDARLTQSGARGLSSCGSAGLAVLRVAGSQTSQAYAPHAREALARASEGDRALHRVRTRRAS
jgi:HEAT repeat protein